MTRRRFPAVFLIVGALLGPAALSAAQTLPTALITAVDLSPPQIDEIEQYVAAQMPRMLGEDREAARRQLLAPLRAARGGPSVRFRQAYSEALLRKREGAPTLADLMVSEKEAIALNAMPVAGEVATPESARLLVKAITDARPQVRIMAAGGLKRTFTAAHRASPAIGSDELRRLVGMLGELVAKEEQVHVLDIATCSLISAMEVIRPGIDGVRTAAAVTLFREAGERVKKLGAGAAASLPVYLRVGQAARDSLAAVNDPQQRLDEAATKQATEFSGRLIGYLVRQIKDFPAAAAGDDPAVAQQKQEARARAFELAQVTEAAAVIGLRTMGRTVAPTNMAEDFRKATAEGDKEFIRKALELLTALELAGMGPFLQGGGAR